MHDLNWDDLRYFVAVVRARGFSGAARQLRVHQSTVSRRVAALEEAVGEALVVRNAGDLVLTAVGERLVADAESVESTVHSLAMNAQDGQSALRGTVRIATLEELAALLVVPRLPEFNAQWPEIHIQVQGSTQLVDLARRDADVALRPVKPRRGDLVVQRVGRLDFAAYAAVAYLKKCRYRGETCLPRLQWMALDVGGDLPETAWVERTAGRVPPVLSTSGNLALAVAASQGAGAAVVPAAVAHQFPSLRRLTDSVHQRDVWLVVHRNLQHLARVRAVMDWLRKVTPSLEVAEPRWFKP